MGSKRKTTKRICKKSSKIACEKSQRKSKLRKPQKQIKSSRESDSENQDSGQELIENSECTKKRSCRNSASIIDDKITEPKYEAHSRECIEKNERSFEDLDCKTESAKVIHTSASDVKIGGLSEDCENGRVNSSEIDNKLDSREKRYSLCSKCDKNMSSFSLLRRHARKYHPDEVDIIAPTKALPPAVRCQECQKTFTKKSNYRHHVKKFHPDLIDELAPPKVFAPTVSCSECQKSFTKISNYRRHVRKFHTDRAHELAPKKCYAYQCEHCGKNFSHMRHFKTHKKKIHHETSTAEKWEKKKCPLCDYKTAFTSEMLKHFQQSHEISIVHERYEFSNEEEFLSWKANTEKTTMSSFVKKHGSYSAKSYKRTKYVCHRSGYFISKGKGLRHLKRQGSSKNNAFCPALMDVTIKPNKYEVWYYKTHVGHDRDLGHLSLTLAERQELAGKIAAKIPFATILDEVRDSISKCRLERVHLLTKKDLYNIERCFKLKSNAVRSKNTTATIKTWIHEMENNGCVLFYKTVGSVSDHGNCKNLSEDDFVLVIMTQGQEEMLNKHGDDCICIDRTHEVSGSNYELFTLLVLDEVREGFPCSFLISNRKDEYVMYLFFSYIEQRLHKKLKPKVFMSDLPEIFYDAWISVMHPAEYRLFCTWHVDITWREIINKIKSKETQVTVYRKLRTLLHEPDVTVFSNMAQQFLYELSTDEETYDFGQNFNLNYMNKVEAWAYCYRIYNGLNTNMHLERVHKTIKYLYLNKKHRLDKSMNSIMKFVRDKLCDRVMSSNKTKLCLKIKDIKSRHEASLHLDPRLARRTENGWEVPSESSDEIYVIQESNAECRCKLICPDCQVCIHQYTCTCLDSNIKWNMCKHIHLISQHRQDEPVSHNNDTDFHSNDTGRNVINVKNCTTTEPRDAQILEVNPGVRHVFIAENDNSYDTFTKMEQEVTEFIDPFPEEQQNQYKLIDEKQKLRISLMQAVDSVSSLEQLEALEKIATQIQTTLAATRSSNDACNSNNNNEHSFESSPKLDKLSTIETGSAVVQLLNL